MNKRVLVQLSCIAVALFLVICIIASFIQNAPFRWSRKLFEAIRMDDTAYALQLIDEGTRHGYSMDTLCEHPSFVWALLESSPQTPLQAACKYGNIRVVQRLLEEGASVKPSQGGLTTDPVLCVLHRSYSPDDLQMIQLLIDYGADSYDNFINCSFITDAAYRAPLDFSASPDPDTGKYPYDESAAKGITDVFLLLSKHCDSYAVNEAGRNALHCAVLMKNWYLVNVLTTEFNYSLDAMDINGETAYDIAKESDAPQHILELLKP